MFALEWLIIALMLAFNAVFAAYEMALASVSHARLVVLTQLRRKGSSAALHMKERMEASFAVIQFGITFFGAVAAALGGAFTDEKLTPLLISLFELPPRAAEILAVVCFVVPLSLFTIIFAELVPKLFAIRNNERVCLALSPFMRALSAGVDPVISRVEKLVKLLVSWGQKELVTEAEGPRASGLHELQAAVALARTSRVIGAHEERIVLSAAQLAVRPIREVILPAADIAMIPVNSTLTEALIQAHLDLHTRFPVCDQAGDPQTIVGYITFKDLVVAIKMKPDTPSVAGILRPIKRISEAMVISQVLEQMMREKVHIALVVAGTGTILGLITLEDIVEEMLGDIEDEFDHLPTHFHPAGTGWIVGGGVSMTTIFQCLKTPLPAGASPGQRLADWGTAALGRPVVKGDVVRHQGLDVVVRKLRRRRVSEAFISLSRPVTQP